MTKPANRDREVVVAANASVATLRDDRDVHAKARAAQLLVKLAYQKPPNRLIIVKAGALVDVGSDQMDGAAPLYIAATRGARLAARAQLGPRT